MRSGTLAGGIAHDFNNVLTAILLSSDHLLLQARPSDASFADLMEIKRNANRAAVARAPVACLLAQADDAAGAS